MGKDFDPVEFLKIAPLENANVRLKGKPLGSGVRFLEWSFFSVSVSDADYHNLQAQINDAIAFLDQHRRQLELIKGFPGTEYASIDFAVNLDVERLVEKQNRNFRFPTELIKTAGELGIGFSIALYPDSSSE